MGFWSRQRQLREARVVEFFEGIQNGPAQQASWSAVWRLRLLGLSLVWGTANLSLLALWRFTKFVTGWNSNNNLSLAFLAILIFVALAPGPIGWLLWRGDPRSERSSRLVAQLSTLLLGLTLGTLFALSCPAISPSPCIGNFG